MEIGRISRDLARSLGSARQYPLSIRDFAYNNLYVKLNRKPERGGGGGEVGLRKGVSLCGLLARFGRRFFTVPQTARVPKLVKLARPKARKRTAPDRG